ncbi:barstar family protein [Advenella mimigardefordensis]|uniref:Putative barstar n=1 Tax=Advenella mimigardefordensis (strain DSM 17166 / LMG 22922 / DPN7) TaxID=1247726 RepID=W0PBX8_ADVMD|nr:barstar family protein [Advenella mimigardefordensis]AHG64379.1 putative barstar [Advenella mimigardefordensis DPN7]
MKVVRPTPAPLKTCELTHIHSIDDVYDQLQVALHLPQYFGRNLDALYDSLSTDVKGPYRIVWLGHARSALDLGESYYEGLLDIFRAVARERGDVQLELE